jgi:hypothetical protein
MIGFRHCRQRVAVAGVSRSLIGRASPGIGQDNGPLGLGQLARRAAILAQRDGRWIRKCEAIRVLFQLLEVHHQSLQSLRITARGEQHPARARVEGTRVLMTFGAVAFGLTKDRPPLLAAGHQ